MIKLFEDFLNEAKTTEIFLDDSYFVDGGIKTIVKNISQVKNKLKDELDLEFVEKFKEHVEDSTSWSSTYNHYPSMNYLFF